MTTANRAALSSLAQVPITEETRNRLLAAGVKADQVRMLSELAGQSLLALHSDLAAEDESYPRCYRKAFDPRDKFCEGCTFQPTCWQGDLKYLRELGQGAVPAPLGVPQVVIDERLNYAATRPVAPPPPEKKSMDAVNKRLNELLDKLGYDKRQIMRMSAIARDQIITQQIQAQYASINPHGELKIIGKPPPMPPRPSVQSRKAPPPPPSKGRKAPPPPPKRK